MTAAELILVFGLFVCINFVLICWCNSNKKRDIAIKKMLDRIESMLCEECKKKIKKAL